MMIRVGGCYGVSFWRCVGITLYAFVVAVVSSFSSIPSTLTRTATLVQPSEPIRLPYLNLDLSLSSKQSVSEAIELQSDSNMYGRGEYHLSASLDVDDVVVVQVGSWLVDGVLVGDDSIHSSLIYVKIDTIQVVWTHNCEHGVLRGTELHVEDDGSTLVPTDIVEFGPEQLIGRLNKVKWDEKSSAGTSPILLSDELWPLMTQWEG